MEKDFPKNGTANQPDAALRPFLESSAAESETLLGDLMTTKIQPVVEKTLRSKLRVSLKPTDFSLTNQEALELTGDINLVLVSELKRLKTNPNGKIIYNLDGYVSSVTVNIYRQYLRSKFPVRRRLKSQLRYLLSHHPKFALWDEEGVWLCGFQKSEKGPKAPDAETIRAGISATVNKNNLREKSQIINLVTAVFEFAITAIPLDDLLQTVAEIQGISERKEIRADEDIFPKEHLAAEDKMLTGLEQKAFLKRVWTEIRALPVRHRVALLLNLKDKSGDAVIRLFPLLRIASIRQIADALEISPEKFAALWNELPWEDSKIAGFLGVTRQQVINLRQSARTRLARVLRE